jgi:hypothetical protein
MHFFNHHFPDFVAFAREAVILALAIAFENTEAVLQLVAVVMDTSKRNFRVDDHLGSA